MSTGAPQERGVTIKYPSVALLCVDSADAEQFNMNGYRIGNSNPASVYINKQAPLLAGYMTRLALTEVNFQWNIPNVNALNNSLTLALFNAAGVYQSVVRLTIPVDFYTLPKLAEILQTQLNTIAGYTFAVEVGGVALTGTANTTEYVARPRITIATSGGTTGFFQIVPYNSRKVQTGAGTSADTNLPILQDDLTNMLGLTPSISASGPFYYSNVTGGYASTQYTPYVDIESSLLTKNQNVADGSTQKINTRSKLARIYLSNDQINERVITITYDADGNFEESTDNQVGCQPFIFHREFAFPKQIQWNSTENVDVVDLELVDYRSNTLPVAQNITVTGTQVTFDNTADFQFTLMATEI